VSELFWQVLSISTGRKHSDTMVFNTVGSSRSVTLGAIGSGHGCDVGIVEIRSFVVRASSDSECKASSIVSHNKVLKHCGHSVCWTHNMPDLTSICHNSLSSKTLPFSPTKDPSDITRSCSITGKRININISTIDIRHRIPMPLTALAQVARHLNVIIFWCYFLV
jgi:hypothetical protein